MNSKTLKKFFVGLRSVAFPSVCACCGYSTAGSGHHICEWCRLQRFESPQIITKDLLPECILHRFSVWAFDKGGMLQDLLHDLKYHHLKEVGLEMGVHLAERYLNSPLLIDELRAEEREPLLIPVPLHRKKQRKRGYNQARVLANGISNRAGWPVVAEQSVVRVKNTITQTGLSSSERQNNLEGAFTLSQPINYDKQIPVLVDDVFTTGATTFELARVLNVTAARKAVILTVASA